MELGIDRMLAEAPGLIDRFETLVDAIRLERKGVLCSAMLFLYCSVRELRPRQIIEFGRTRAQSALILGLCFPDVPIVSGALNADSRDMPIAEGRLADRRDVARLFGDPSPGSVADGSRGPTGR